MKGNTEMVELLINNGADINAKTNNGDCALHLALRLRAFKLAEWLLESCANINEQYKFLGGPTPFTLASENLEMTKWLVENGFDVNSKNLDGVFVFQNALSHGKLKICLFLLEHGAKVNRRFLNVKMKSIINSRIQEIKEIREVIKAVMFPDDQPVVAHIVAEFTTGLENLQQHV